LVKHASQNCPTLLTYAGIEGLPLQSYKGIPLSGLNLRIVGAPSASAMSDSNMVFQKDHMTLVEPEGENDLVHIWVRDNLKACIDGSSVCKGNLTSQEFKECGRPLDEFPSPDLHYMPPDPTDVLFNR
jgi:hypothetical protein